jgi:hypothetical protein
MKVEIINFDIKAFTNSLVSVITKNGRSVNILRTDAKGDYPIQGTINFGNFSDIFSWKKDGTCKNNIEDYSLRLLCNSVKDGEFVIKVDIDPKTGISKLSKVIICVGTILFNDCLYYYAMWDINSSEIKFDGSINISKSSNIIEADKKNKDNFKLALNNIKRNWIPEKKLFNYIFEVGDIIKRNYNDITEIVVYRGYNEKEICVISDLIVTKDSLKRFDQPVNCGDRDRMEEWVPASEDDKKFLENRIKSEYEKNINFEDLKNKWCLMRNNNLSDWSLCKFDKKQIIEKEEMFISAEGLAFKYCIPYNDDTKHLLGTKEIK